MHNVQHRDIGHVFWIPDDTCSYDRMSSYIREQECSLGSSEYFLLTNNRVFSSPVEQIIIPWNMIMDRDLTIASILRTMAYKSTILVEDANVDELYKAALIFASILGDSFCTVIDGMPSLVNIIEYRILNGGVWVPDANGYTPVPISKSEAPLLQAIQHNRGSQIISLRRAISYLQSCIDWNDGPVILATIDSLSSYNPGKLMFSNTCHCSNTSSISSFRVICLDSIPCDHLTDDWEHIFTWDNGRMLKMDGLLITDT